jgi:hypothetical protein
MPPHTDLLGTRLRRTTAEGAEDVLEVRNDLSATGSFEFPLRERVLRLAGFHHRSFARVHRVERAPGRHGALAIVSDAADGVLLCDIPAAAAERGPAIPAACALDIVRQLLDGLSAMHAIARDVSHGALTPAHILIGFGGEALIRDYVFGGALEQLAYSTEQYWTELGVPTTPEAPGIDQRLDLFQIGLLGLQLLGERVSQSTLARAGRQRAVSALAASGEAGPLVADARRWLARALQLDAPFTSALDARKDLESLLARHASISARVTGPAEWLRAVAPHDRVTGDVSHAAPADRPLSQSSSAMAPVVSIDSREADARSAATDDHGVDLSQRQLSQPTAPVASPRVDTPRVTMPPPVAAQVTPAPAISRRTLSRVYPALGLVALVVAAVVALYVPINGHDTGSPAATSTLVTPGHDGPAARDVETHATTGSLSDPGGDRRIGDRRGDANAALAAGADGGGSNASPSPPPRSTGATGTLQVRTQPAGAQVWVDGLKAGRSPATLNVAPGEHRIEVSSDGALVKDMVTVQRDATTSVIIPLPAAPRAEIAAAAPRAETAAAAGWIGITSPIDVEVFEGDQLIATKETRRLMLPAGTHQLDIVNGDLGYASRRIVNVTPNKLTPLKVELSPGTLAINALPWAEVSLDGQSLGTTPIGNVKTSIGSHEVVFRHPKLGEQRRTVVVPLSGIARISVDMGAK